MSFPLTTEELAKMANLTVPTIREWRRLGLFVGIKTTKKGGSGGVRILWAASAADRVAEIVKLKGEGWGTDALREKFAAEARAWQNG
ncbi:MerR family transcriptional regulator [Nannocystis pusilla]|uniref:MerR family transcriptional regulator n=1 Tax=Nannocystis pusilla TaxID=889268 RepID=UPI003BF278C6